jgi:hypothetical protein
MLGTGRLVNSLKVRFIAVGHAEAHSLSVQWAGTRFESSSLHLGVSPVITRNNLRRSGSILILTAKIKASLGELGLVTVLD